jgi:hypothetical protein
VKAVVCRHWELEVTDVLDLGRDQGKILLSVSRSGICGSDLHLCTRLDHRADIAATAGSPRFSGSEQDVVFAHEFSGGGRGLRAWYPPSPEAGHAPGGDAHTSAQAPRPMPNRCSRPIGVRWKMKVLDWRQTRR